MSSARDSPVATAFASRAAASTRLMAMFILILRGSPNMAPRAWRPLPIFGFPFPAEFPSAFLFPNGAPLPRPDFFRGGIFFVFFGARHFWGRFLFLGIGGCPPYFKAFCFRYGIIMAVLADCQSLFGARGFPPLIGSRGAFAAASGGFWRPVLKGKKIQLLKINNLWRKSSDYHSLHVRLRARGGRGCLKIARSPIINILVRKKFFCLKTVSQNTHQNDKSL